MTVLVTISSLAPAAVHAASTHLSSVAAARPGRENSTIRHLGLLLVALPVLPNTTHTGPWPGALSVQVADLPHGTVLSIEVTGTAEQLAGQHRIAWSTEQRRGLVVGNGRLFAIGGLDPHGPVLGVNVGRYASVASAHAAFLAVLGSAPASTLLAMGAVGDERAGLQRPIPGQTPPPLLGLGAVRRGTYVISIALLSPSRIFPLGKVSQLAALVDGRIRHAR